VTEAVDSLLDKHPTAGLGVDIAHQRNSPLTKKSSRSRDAIFIPPTYGDGHASLDECSRRSQAKAR
jgi:hypothetical protein